MLGGHWCSEERSSKNSKLSCFHPEEQDHTHSLGKTWQYPGGSSWQTTSSAKVLQLMESLDLLCWSYSQPPVYPLMSHQYTTPENIFQEECWQVRRSQALLYYLFPLPSIPVEKTIAFSQAHFSIHKSWGIQECRTPDCWIGKSTGPRDREPGFSGWLRDQLGWQAHSR